MQGDLAIVVRGGAVEHPEFPGILVEPQNAPRLPARGLGLLVDPLAENHEQGLLVIRLLHPQGHGSGGLDLAQLIQQRIELRVGAVTPGRAAKLVFDAVDGVNEDPEHIVDGITALHQTQHRRGREWASSGCGRTSRR
jgi:hypothetical protein